MSKLGRRTFLGGLAAVSAAPTTAAKAAAQSMGLGSVFSGAQSVGGFVGKDFPSTNQVQCEPDAKWCIQRIAELTKRLGEVSLEDYELRECSLRARTLDADLAAMRSMSPAAAFQAQYAREVERQMERERRCIRRDIERLQKQLGPIAEVFA